MSNGALSASAASLQGNLQEQSTYDNDDFYFTYLTFGGTFRRVLNIFFERFDVYLALAGTVLIPFGILFATIAIWLSTLLIHEEEDASFQPHHLPLLGLVLIVQLLLYVSVTILGRGATIIAVVETYINGSGSTSSGGGSASARLDWRRCLARAMPHFKPLIAAQGWIAMAMIVAAVIPYFSLLLAATHPNLFTIFLCAVVFLGFATVTAFGLVSVVMTSPAIVVEGHTKGMDGIKRSWELSNGSRCYLFCTLLCLYFAHNLITRLLHNMFLSEDPLDIFFSFTGIVVSFLPMIAFFPLFVILETVMYLNLRIGRESLNRSMLSNEFYSGQSHQPNDTNNRDYDTGSNFGFSLTSSVLGGSAFGFGTPRHENSSMAAANTDYRQVPLMDDEVNMPSPTNNHTTASNAGFGAGRFQPPQPTTQTSVV